MKTPFPTVKLCLLDQRALPYWECQGEENAPEERNQLSYYDAFCFSHVTKNTANGQILKTGRNWQKYLFTSFLFLTT